MYHKFRVTAVTTLTNQRCVLAFIDVRTLSLWSPGLLAAIFNRCLPCCEIIWTTPHLLKFVYFIFFLMLLADWQIDIPTSQTTDLFSQNTVWWFFSVNSFKTYLCKYNRVWITRLSHFSWKKETLDRWCCLFPLSNVFLYILFARFSHCDHSMFYRKKINLNDYK